MPDGQLPPPPAPAPANQSGSDASPVQQPAQEQPAPPAAEEGAPAAEKQPAKPKFPILLSGTFEATVVNQPDPTRKHFAAAIPWSAELKPGAACTFKKVSSGIPKLDFVVPNAKQSVERSIKIAFSMPAAFLANQVTLSGLQIEKYAKLPKKKQKAKEPDSNEPAKKQKPAPKETPSPPPPPPPPPEYKPAAGFKLLAKPAEVTIGSFIAHRFDTDSWERGWCEGLVEKQCGGKRYAGQFEVKYEGLQRELTVSTTQAHTCTFTQIGPAFHRLCYQASSLPSTSTSWR